ncbi:SRPBCC domain-containing protein [Maricaulis sp.]|uniref:SRPBCC family protein n=1 Tax=Maricaulis sp. TaxID=1486257 RepID=UPI00260CE08D|nr:SRPBCC domain-containing protein [Maricaulis sp.]
MTTDNDWVRVERRIKAPIGKVWAMWTDPNLFRKWYGPNGMTVPAAEMDVVVGGRRKVCMQMQTPERTMTMWFVGEYKEIDAPRRLVYTESMADEAGNIVSPQGMPEAHPDVTEVIVELSESDGHTLMKMTHVGVPAGSAGAGGWAQAIDKLEALFAGARA